MVQSEKVKNDTLVWAKDMLVWEAAKTIAELQNLFTQEVEPPSDKADSAPPQRNSSLKFGSKYYLLNGPFNIDTLIQMVQSGELTESSLVWTQGRTDLVSAGTIAELQPLFRDKAPAKRFHFGLGIEATGYSRDGLAPGATVSAGFSFMSVLLAGITIGYFNNFDGLSTIEAGGFLRGGINFKKCTLFAQGEGGIALFLENTEMTPSYFAGGKLGVLINLKKVKLGPYVGVGVPYLFAGGILLSI
jgi:hypothetical protein